MSNQECIDYLIAFLRENKVKEYNINSEDEDLILFTVGDTEFSIFVEDFENVHFGISKMHDVEVSRDFWQMKDECENYLHIEDFFFHVVKQKQHSYIKKMWKIFEKMDEEYEDATEIAALYFDLIQ